MASLPHPVAGATPWGQAYLTGLGGQGGEWSASGQVVWGDRAESGQPVVRWSGGLVAQSSLDVACLRLRHLVSIDRSPVAQSVQFTGHRGD